MRPLVLCAVLGGCGFQATRALDPDAAPQEPDGGDGAVDGAIDGAIDGADCFARWRDGSVALSPPQRLTSVNGGGDDRDPWISRDRLTLYFASNRNVINEIFRAGRTSTSLPFGPPDRLINLTVAGKQQDRASLTDDQRLLVLSSNRGGRFQIFVTGRPDTTTEFGSPNQDHLALVNAGNVDNFDPFIATDARRLYLTTDPGGPVHPRLVVATRLDAGGDFAAPSDVPGVNVNGSDSADPALSPDERVIVFSSNRSGGRGKLDLWYAVRSDAQRDFSPPVPIPTVNTDEDDADPMLSADGCELYFAARQDGDFDLYVSQVAH